MDKISMASGPAVEDKPTLYFHPYNFHSQKVLLILYEKQIDFTPYVLNLSAGEQYSPWFLNLNPKGDVPVLKDGCFVIPNSQEIINYIDRKFQNKNEHLSRKKFSSKEFERVEYFQLLFNQLPIGAISLGSFIHDDLNLSPKPPFIGHVRKACLSNNDKVHGLLKASAANNVVNADVLLKKITVQNRRKEIVNDRLEYQKLLDATEKVLQSMEIELARGVPKEWLISNEFSLADISFGLLLYRLYSLGFEQYFWTYGKRPLIESYFLRFRNRPSFDKLTPKSMDILKEMWNKTPANYKLGAGVVGMAMFAALAHK